MAKYTLKCDHCGAEIEVFAEGNQIKHKTIKPKGTGNELLDTLSGTEEEQKEKPE